MRDTNAITSYFLNRLFIPSKSARPYVRSPSCEKENKLLIFDDLHVTCNRFLKDITQLVYIYLAPSISFLVQGRRRKAKLYARGRRRA